MDAQAWAWLIFIIGQLAIVPTSIRLHRAQDPRDQDGRKVPVDPARVAAARRMQAWGFGFWGACVLGSCTIRVVDDPAQLPWVSIVLGVGAVALGVATWVSRARAARRAREPDGSGGTK